MRIYKRRMYCEPLRSNIKNKELIQNFYIEREKEYCELTMKRLEMEGII